MVVFNHQQDLAWELANDQQDNSTASRRLICKMATANLFTDVTLCMCSLPWDAVTAEGWILARVE